MRFDIGFAVVTIKFKTPKAIIRAAPTCTLWKQHPVFDLIVFRPFKRWKISHLELYQCPPDR